MSKIKLSLVEKKLVRTLFIFVLIQSLIILLFIHMLCESQPINLRDTKQIDVIVDDVYYFKALSEFRLNIYSNSTEYLFTSRGTSAEYSVSKLYETISVGDQLSLIYYETDSILGKRNWIVDARTDAEIYRSFEEYNKGKKGLGIAVSIVFFIVEIVFLGVLIIYVWINGNVLRGLCKKLKHLKNGM